MSQVFLPVHTEEELEYNKFLRDKMVVAKNEFRALLRETKKITYRLVEPLPHCITQSHSQTKNFHSHTKNRDRVG